MRPGPSDGLDHRNPLVGVGDPHRRAPDADLHGVFNSVSIRPINPIESLILVPGLDIALMWCPGGDGSTLSSPALAVGPAIATDPRAVLVPAGHPLAYRAAIVLDDLIGHLPLEPG
jgi:hypothetical protein